MGRNHRFGYHEAVNIYHAEISSSKVRGFFCSFTHLFISIGIFVVYALSTINGFKYYKSSLTIVGIIAAYEIMMNFIPESPWWLIANGKKALAKETLMQLRGPDYSIETELEAMEMSISNAPNLKALQLFHVLYNKTILVSIFIIVFVMFFQQISGLNAASSYATLIFKDAGIAKPSQAASYGVGSISIAFTILAILIVDRIGRKILLLVSGVGMLLGTVMLGTHFYITRPSLCEEVPCGTQLASLCDNFTLSSEDIVCNTLLDTLALLCENTNLNLSSDDVACNTSLDSLCENNTNNTNLTLTSEDNSCNTRQNTLCNLTFTSEDLVCPSLASLCVKLPISFEDVECKNFLDPLASLCANHTNPTLPSKEVVCNSHFAPLAIVSLMLFFAAFSIGWGPVPWILMGELLPLHVRGFGSSLGIFTNWGTAALVVGFYFNYSDFVNLWFSWWTFSVFNLIGVLFVIFILPETKGKNLEEISKEKIIPTEGENLDHLECDNKSSENLNVMTVKSHEEISKV